MKPPRCVICKKGFRIEHGKSGGVYFKESKTDKAYNQNMKTKKIVGHPAAYDWFCEKHYKKANQLKELTRTEAIQQINDSI